MRSRFLSGASLAIVGAVVLWGCGKGSGGGTPAGPSGPPQTGPQTVTVNIIGSAGNGAYRPNPVTANTGDTVVFKNTDSQVHHIVLDDGSADLGDLTPGGTSRGFVVKNQNAANYHCMLHSSMVGSVNADAPPEPPPCNDPYGYGC